jgi:7,8-dihydro-6-hydroxymethylpterin dimethyltransferase
LDTTDEFPMKTQHLMDSPSLQKERLSRLASSMQKTGQWHPRQAAGRRWTIGCVSLEITQRCNLDCTLCYLSESSEAVQDVPLEELYRRIDEIAVQYGPNTDVQISGGDPTLRDRGELSQIVRYVRAQGLRASLFTNGILLTREWLSQLARDGLNDVAFHVDLTQERKGFKSEEALNQVRRKYIEMARDLPLSVIFNTTIYADNFHEVSALARFFVVNSDVVRFASFQLGADTGRGTVAGRIGAVDDMPADTQTVTVTQASVCAAISKGAGVPLNFEALQGGHSLCNKYAMLFAMGDKRFDALADGEFVARVMRETAGITLHRDQGLSGALALARAFASKPALWLGGLGYLAKLVWWSKREWFKPNSSPRKISFFTHNFMDACGLDPERIDACVFMAASASGLMSMCTYNAERDQHLLKPIVLKSGQVFQPLAVAPNAQGEVVIPLKWLKGRTRQDALVARAVSRQQTRV